jgi:RNA polymerase sigma-70 factor (ECF subfamily)
MVPDLSLILGRARDGDERAFEALYELHAPRVYALALRMTRSPAAAEDVLQDVFLKAWRALASFRGECRFGTWLHRIAVRVVLDGRRAERPESPLPDTLQAVAAATGATLDVERSIAALPPRARLVLLLIVAGHTYEEVAAIMETEVGTVKAQLHRARQLVREALR